MKIQDLLEARRNPELNPKISINDAMASYLKTHKGKKCYISFTAIEKLGVNPRTKYNTPVGVYCYPLEYAIKLMGSEQSGAALPFAGESPFANLFYVKSRDVIDLAKIEDYEVDGLEDQLQPILPSSIYKNVKKHIQNAQSYAHDTTAGGQFWYVVYTCASEWSSESKVRISVLMTKIFRALGYAGLVDRKGQGIIHKAEPTQAVIFDPSVIADVRRVNNKYAPNALVASKAQGARVRSAAAVMKEQIPYTEKLLKLMKGSILSSAPQSLLNEITPADALTVAKAMWSSVQTEDHALQRLFTRLVDTKKRLPKCEEFIKTDAFLSLDYAMSVLGTRFLPGEETIKNDKVYWPRYIYKFPEAAK